MLYLLKTLLFIEILMAAGLFLFRFSLLPNERKLVSAKLAAIAMVTPAVALFCGNIYIFYLYLAVIIAFSARARDELAGAYLFLLPLMPMMVVETRVGGAYLFGLSTISAMGLGATIGFFITGRRKTFTSLRYDLAILAIIAIFVLTVNRDFSFTGMLRLIATNILTGAGPYLLVSRAARSPAELERLLIRLCLGAMLVAVTAIFQAARHWVVFETYYQALNIPVPFGTASMSLRAGFLRTGGSMIDYSAAGLFLAAIITLMPLLRRRFSTHGFWLAMATFTAALLATQSRGAWVATLVGIVFVAAYRGQWGRVLFVAGGAAGAEALVFLFARSGPLAQILGKGTEASGTADYRRQLATQGFDQVLAHPWIGQPLDRLVANLSDLTQGQHIVDFVNGHLYIAMIGGIPAFLVWAWAWLMPIIEGLRYRNKGDGLGAVPAAIIVPILVALIFTSIIDRNVTWLMMALAVAPACFAFSRPSAARTLETGGGARPAVPHWRPSMPASSRAEPAWP